MSGFDTLTTHNYAGASSWPAGGVAGGWAGAVLLRAGREQPCTVESMATSRTYVSPFTGAGRFCRDATGSVSDISDRCLAVDSAAVAGLRRGQL